jgi:glycosyltransferase involved in cell wall biosynthesis
MRIGMILDNKFPPDFRVEKEINSLQKKHKIFLLCYKRGKQKDREEWCGINVQRIFNGFERRWSNWRLIRTNFSHHWRIEIEKFVINNQIDVLHVHDLPLVRTAISVGEKMHIPVIADLHENYPALLELETNEPLYNAPSLGTLIVRMSVSIEGWKKYEKTVITKADMVITVIEEAKQRLIDLGVPPSKIHVVANYNLMNVNKLDEKQTIVRNNPFRIVYAGGFGPSRDLKTLIHAASLIQENEIQNLEILMLGAMGRTYSEMKRYAAQMGVEDKVSVYKWMPMEEAEKIMNSAHVGLVPHSKSDHTDSTIPHKLFQYMDYGLPIIVSNCKPLERIIRDSGTGLVYRSGDAKSLASCLIEIYQNPAKSKEMGRLGTIAVKEKYNWNNAEKVLLKLYDELVH